MSLKKDHDQEKIVLKYGDWQKGNRKEIEVLLQKEQFQKALSLLKGLGFKRGYKVPAYGQDFRYQGVQISLKTKAVIDNHFERETTVNDQNMAQGT
ncbi:hypothetical protein HYU11_04640, partial [Candidatus Woesearchaeota archaeon]|nr:hypothetical protein [Candidatus Woesearchaeota archaeon]